MQNLWKWGNKGRLSTLLFFVLYAFFTAAFSAVYAQEWAADAALVSASFQRETPARKKKEKTGVGQFVKTYNPVSLSLNGLLTVYQQVISPQISADCLYQTSCSRFSREVLGAFGPIKGVFLTADRLSRCNRITATTLHPLRFGPDLRVKDDLEYYSLKYHREYTK